MLIRKRALSVIALLMTFLILPALTLNAQDWRVSGSQRAAVEGTSTTTPTGGYRISRAGKKEIKAAELERIKIADDEKKVKEEAERKAEREAKEVADTKAREEAERIRREEAEKREIENKKAMERMKGNTSQNFGLKGIDENNGIQAAGTNDFGLKNITTNDPEINIETLPPKYKKWDIDHIEVPPPSWEDQIAMEANQIRLGQANDGNKYLMMADNAFAAAYDLAATNPETWPGGVALAALKLLIIGTKSTIAAMDEAEIVVFTQSAMYEKMLLYLKDKKLGPQLLAALKSVQEKKPMPAGISQDMIRLAYATQYTNSGISSKHIVMNAMLSKEAKGAFFEAAKMEGMEALNSGIRGLVNTDVQTRFAALRKVDEKISEGQELLKTETNPALRSYAEKKIKVLENKITAFEHVPDWILNFISFSEEYKKTKNEIKPGKL